jgi:hypothetical protein
MVDQSVDRLTKEAYVARGPGPRQHYEAVISTPVRMPVAIMPAPQRIPISMTHGLHFTTALMTSRMEAVYGGQLVQCSVNIFAKSL